MVNNLGLIHAVEVVDVMPRASSIKFRNVSRAGQNRVAGRTWPAGRVLHVVGLDHAESRINTDVNKEVICIMQHGHTMMRYHGYQLHPIHSQIILPVYG